MGPNTTNTAASPGFQAGPSAEACNWYVTQGGHRRMQVGLGDGSVRGVSSGVSTQTWTFACTPNDGNELGSDSGNSSLNLESGADQCRVTSVTELLLPKPRTFECCNRFLASTRSTDSPLNVFN